jgi:hypothetical protein
MNPQPALTARARTKSPCEIPLPAPSANRPRHSRSQVLAPDLSRNLLSHLPTELLTDIRGMATSNRGTAPFLARLWESRQVGCVSRLKIQRERQQSRCGSIRCDILLALGN